MNATAAPSRHSLFDDAQGLLTGTLFVALALVMFRQAGLVTGGTAGLAFIAHYALGVPFGAAFFAINLPFYALAWRRMGARFTLKTFAAVALLSLLAEAVPRWVVLQSVHPAFAALGGGLLMGAGLLILFRHRASLGGLNVLVLWLQNTRGWRAGKVQMGLDALILLAASPWIGAQALLWSVLAAVALNFALAVNHKPGRYAAV
ncbi:YitT family protein [Rubrivivax albus]|uniref:YitT family protein n=1 Tax=Rubrivivax albus TaxID=2499835 RepID=A0A437JNX6_9BURK|nr:YitT family protein [Rubrivivax albus]RVT48469.1 YitT family protein [Rubrivivax albus]